MVLHLRREREQAFGMESFLTLGLIALTYGLALTAHTYGFLAVFVAGLAMRSVEYTDSDGRRAKASRQHDASPEASAYMARAVLDFTLDLERLAELTVMLLVGSLLHAGVFSGLSLGIAAALLLVVRPLAVRLTLIGSRLTPTQRRLAALVRHPRRGLGVLPGVRHLARRHRERHRLGGRRRAGHRGRFGAAARHLGDAGDAAVSPCAPWAT